MGPVVAPEITGEAHERIKLLTQENAQLRAELGSLRDRMVSVERIVTDSGYRSATRSSGCARKGKVQ